MNTLISVAQALGRLLLGNRTKFSLLSLGTREDAKTWMEKCSELGFLADVAVREFTPSMNAFEDFFASAPEWLFFGGHFPVGALTLANKDEAPTASVTFASDSVTVQTEGNVKVLRKALGEFRLHSVCQVVFWGGCRVAESVSTIRTLRRLFGKHLLLGFSDRTGWRILQRVFGGPLDGKVMESNFFKRLEGNQHDLEKVRGAWLGAAKQWYGGTKKGTHFRAIDPDGQEWLLTQAGEIKKGRNFP